MPIKGILIFLLALQVGGTSVKDSESVARVQSSWDKTRTYQAKFHQTVTARRMGSTDESVGEVFVQKPGKIRWDIKSEGKFQILNGPRLVHVQVPKRRKANVVDLYENIKDKLDTKGLSFLTGSEEFKKAYVANILRENKKSVVLKFVPKTSTGGDTYIAEFDKSGYLLRSLVTESADTSVKTVFSDIKTNLPIAEDLFEYKPGPTDVVTVNK